MNNQYSRTLSSVLLSVAFSVLLTACGGGGGGSDSPTEAPIIAQTVNPPTTQPVETASTAPEITELTLNDNNEQEVQTIIESTAQKSSEITVPNGFTLNSERFLNFKIMRSVEDNQAAYLSVCSDYQYYDDGSYIINYNSCVLRVLLTDINYETVISVTNDTQGLVAALWFMDSDKEPLIMDWRF